MKINTPNSALVGRKCFAALLAVTLAACGNSSQFTETVVQNPAPAPAPAPPPAIPTIPGPVSVTASMPGDLPGGAPNASLKQAAAFAWQEFIALSWPAVPQTGALGTRDTPDLTRPFGDPTYRGPLVWETYRHKAEIYPASGDPQGYELGEARDFGYDQGPRYVYPAPQPTGPVTSVTPWNNLDESTEIGVATMFAGVGPVDGGSNQQLMYQAKANRTQYKYVADNGWFGAVAPPFAQTAAFLAANIENPTAGSSDFVSFPSGTIELKAAMRRLGPSEDPGRFYTTTARHYETAANGQVVYRDDVYALVGLHIVQKTPSAPYWTYATFEQIDNILDVDGHPTENPDGSLIDPDVLGETRFDPEVTSRDAVSANPPTIDTIQKLMPAIVDSIPGARLHYVNTSGTALPQGTVSINRRAFAIPDEVIEINKAAQAAIAKYSADHGIANSPWQYYRLTNVQTRPFEKVPGARYKGPDVATYYMSNSVIETDWNLQIWSGRLQQPVPGLERQQHLDLITDFNLDGTPTTNVVFQGKKYIMGGCMGCHGNISVNAGSDFSFIMRGQRVESPDPVGEPPIESERLQELKTFLHDLENTGL